MSNTADDLTWLIDREKIRECLSRLARGEDRRDASLIRQSCWPDLQTDYGIFAGGFEAYLAWVVPGSPAVLLTQHVLGQSHILLESGTARVETQVMAYHRADMGGEEHDLVIGGRYLDRLERRDGSWRVAERTMLYDWVTESGRAIDWAQGLMGAPLSSQHHIGQKAGDYSEAFFKTRAP